METQESAVPDNRDPHVADGKWEFDESVTKVFDKMLANSIPGYETMRWTTTNLALKFLPVEYQSHILDVGASRGQAVLPIIKERPLLNVTAVEPSEAMFSELDAALRAAVDDHHRVNAFQKDFREFDLPHQFYDVVLSVLTLMFIPIEDRQAELQKLYLSLKPGGALFLVEKTLGSTPMMNALMVEEYYDMKARNGYTQEQIERKRLSLQGVLVPVLPRWNEDMLREVGFTNIECYWKTLQFTGWIAVK